MSTATPADSGRDEEGDTWEFEVQAEVDGAWAAEVAAVPAVDVAVAPAPGSISQVLVWVRPDTVSAQSAASAMCINPATRVSRSDARAAASPWCVRVRRITSRSWRHRTAGRQPRVIDTKDERFSTTICANLLRPGRLRKCSTYQLVCLRYSQSPEHQDLGTSHSPKSLILGDTHRPMTVALQGWTIMPAGDRTGLMGAGPVTGW